VLAKGTNIENFEVEHNFRDIGRKTLLVNARRIHGMAGEAGETRMVLLAMEDATGHAAARDALLASEEKFFRAFHANPVMMAISRLEDGRYVDVNESFTQNLGYSREEALGRTPVDLGIYASPQDRQAIKEELLKKGSAQDIELLIMTRAGKPRNVLLSAVILELQGEKCLMSIVLDITERVRAEEERRAHEEGLRDLIDLASHELRHPITIMKGYAVILRDMAERIDEGTREVVLNCIEHGADRLNSLVSELLDVSSIERGRFHLSREEHELAPLVERAIREMKERECSTRFTLPASGELGTGTVDARRVVQALIILLENAAKFSHSGAPVDLQAARQAGELEMAELDRGIGIPADELEAVFGRFYQVEEVAHHSIPGMGMGLYIARRIVEAHGGRIWCEAREGGGTVFRFTLPLEGEEGIAEQDSTGGLG
jgi:PAS domain S-box-containing protein